MANSNNSPGLAYILMLSFPFVVFVPSAFFVYTRPQSSFTFIPLPSVIVGSEPSNYIFGLASIVASVAIVTIARSTYKFLRGKGRYSESTLFRMATITYMILAVFSSIALMATSFFNVSTETTQHFTAKGFFFGLSLLFFFYSDALLSTWNHHIPVGFWAADVANLLIVIVYVAGELYVVKQDNLKKISPVSLVGYLCFVTVFIRYFFQSVLLKSVSKSLAIKAKVGRHKN